MFIRQCDDGATEFTLEILRQRADSVAVPRLGKADARANLFARGRRSVQGWADAINQSVPPPHLHGLASAHQVPRSQDGGQIVGKFGVGYQGGAMPRDQGANLVQSHRALGTSGSGPLNMV